MSDKEILFQAFNKYAKDLASNLFHLNSLNKINKSNSSHD